MQQEGAEIVLYTVSGVMASDNATRVQLSDQGEEILQGRDGW